MATEEIGQWLNKNLLETNRNDLYLPTKYDGTFYTIDQLKDDQKDIVAVILNTLKHFIEDDEFNPEKQFLRMTITGVAGSGKSILINTIVTILRRIFQYNECIQVFAPTGSAAFAAGGETIHRGFKLPNSYQNMIIDSKRMEYYIKRFDNTVAIIFDERSLIDATNLGAMEYYCKETLRQKNVHICHGEEYQLLY